MHGRVGMTTLTVPLLAGLACAPKVNSQFGADASTSQGSSSTTGVGSSESTSDSSSSSSGLALDACGVPSEGMAGQWARFTIQASTFGPTRFTCTFDAVISDAVTRLECIGDGEYAQPEQAFLRLEHPALQQHLAWLRDEPSFEVWMQGSPFQSPDGGHNSDPGWFAVFLSSGEPALVGEHYANRYSGPILVDNLGWDGGGNIVDDGCAERPAVRIDNEVERPLGISLEVDDGRLTIYDQQVRQITVNGEVFTVFLFDAYDTVSRVGECGPGAFPGHECPPDGVYFAIVPGAVEID